MRIFLVATLLTLNTTFALSNTHPPRSGDENLIDYFSRPDVVQYLNELTKTEVSLNQVSLLHMGRSSRTSRLDLVQKAKQSVLIKMPYWNYDLAGREQLESLRQARSNGADVKVMFDWMTPAQSKQLWDRPVSRELKEITGNQLFTWSPIWWQRPFSFNILRNRLHDKVLIVDGKSVVIGGMNYADHYLYGGEKRDGWHDTDILINGPAAREATRYFLTSWELVKNFSGNQQFPATKESRAALLQKLFWDKQESVDYKVLARSHSDRDKRYQSLTLRAPFYSQYEEYYPELSAEERAFTTPVRVIYDDTLVDRDIVTGKAKSKIIETVRLMVRLAQKQVTFMAPYLTITKETKNEILAAAKRGVRVRILTNSVDSHDLGKFPYLGTAEDVHEMTQNGVEVYEWLGQKQLEAIESSEACKIPDVEWYGHTLHTKGVSVDGEILLLGSHNFNVRSDRFNNEIAALVESREQAQEFESIFEYNMDKDSSQWFVTCGDKKLERAQKVNRVHPSAIGGIVEEKKFWIKILRNLKFMM